MHIKRIKDYDIAAQEADIIISDGQYEILCYAHPFEHKEKNTFVLSSFGNDNVMRAFDKTCFIEKNEDNYYGYKLQGKLIDVKQRLVAIGKIVIELEEVIPKDILVNEFVEFTVERIDFIE